MKTKVLIEFETSNMKPFYDEENWDKNKDDCTNVADEVEKSFHVMLKRIFTHTSDILEDTLLEAWDERPENCDSLSDIGEVTIKTTILKD